jgi:hypothetical protein
VRADDCGPLCYSLVGALYHRLERDTYGRIELDDGSRADPACGAHLRARNLLVTILSGDDPGLAQRSPCPRCFPHQR